MSAAALHTKAYRPEEPEQANDKNIQGPEDDPVHVPIHLPRRPINAESRDQDRKVERGVIMMHIGNTTHSDERQIVQEPSNDWVETSIVNLIDVDLLEVIVTALPADEVPHDHDGKDAERGGAAPVDSWVTEQEVLDD